MRIDAKLTEVERLKLRRLATELKTWQPTLEHLSHHPKLPPNALYEASMLYCSLQRLLHLLDQAR
jgi:predicted component of type VI protein secretion system